MAFFTNVEDNRSRRGKEVGMNHHTKGNGDTMLSPDGNNREDFVQEKQAKPFFDFYENKSQHEWGDERSHYSLEEKEVTPGAGNATDEEKKSKSTMDADNMLKEFMVKGEPTAEREDSHPHRAKTLKSKLHSTARRCVLQVKKRKDVIMSGFGPFAASRRQDKSESAETCGDEVLMDKHVITAYGLDLNQYEVDPSKQRKGQKAEKKKLNGYFHKSTSKMETRVKVKPSASSSNSKQLEEDQENKEPKIKKREVDCLKGNLQSKDISLGKKISTNFDMFITTTEANDKEASKDDGVGKKVEEKTKSKKKTMKATPANKKTKDATLSRPKEKIMKVTTDFSVFQAEQKENQKIFDTGKQKVSDTVTPFDKIVSARHGGGDGNYEDVKTKICAFHSPEPLKSGMEPKEPEKCKQSPNGLDKIFKSKEFCDYVANLKMENQPDCLRQRSLPHKKDSGLITFTPNEHIKKQLPTLIETGKATSLESLTESKAILALQNPTETYECEETTEIIELGPQMTTDSRSEKAVSAGKLAWGSPEITKRNEAEERVLLKKNDPEKCKTVGTDTVRTDKTADRSKHKNRAESDYNSETPKQTTTKETLVTEGFDQHLKTLFQTKPEESTNEDQAESMFTRDDSFSPKTNAPKTWGQPENDQPKGKPDVISAINEVSSKTKTRDEGDGKKSKMELFRRSRLIKWLPNKRKQEGLKDDFSFSREKNRNQAKHTLIGKEK